MPAACSLLNLKYAVQVYIGGEFVGGADVLEEMQQKGELKSLLSGS